jgi:curved DNA-binding protein CbpA
VNAEERAAYRAFVRENHPDRGGDPEEFVAGLARFREAEPPVDDTTADPRYDAPVEVVHPLPFPVRVGVALIRTWHRRRNQRVL